MSRQTVLQKVRAQLHNEEQRTGELLIQLEGRDRTIAGLKSELRNAELVHDTKRDLVSNINQALASHITPLVRQAQARGIVVTFITGLNPQGEVAVNASLAELIR